jgi:hypothetical protein
MARQCDLILEWREQYARRCLRVDFEPLAGAIFHASIKSIFPELRIVRAALSPGFLFRDHDLTRDGDDRIGFVVAQSGRLTARHLGRELRLAPGDATMMLMRTTGGVGWRESAGLFDMLFRPQSGKRAALGPRTGLCDDFGESLRRCNCCVATFVLLKGSDLRLPSITTG